MEYRQFSQLSRRQKLNRLHRLATAAIGLWDLEIDAVRFYGEHSNVLFKLRDQNGVSYVLKIARPGDHALSEIEASLEWLAFLNGREGQPLMAVVPSRAGRLVEAVQLEFLDEPRFCALFHWVDGPNLSSRLSLKNAVQWGRLSAWIHRQSARYSAGEKAGALMRWDRVFYWDEEVLFTEASIARFMPEERRGIFEATTQAVGAVITELFAGQQSPILLHGDLHPENVKITADGAVAMDVEDVMWGFPVQDIAISLCYVRQEEKWTKLRDAFRRGYEELLPWPVESDRQLGALFCGRLLMFANYVVKLKDWSDTEKEEALTDYESSFREFLR